MSKWNLANIPHQKGKIAIVTGANTGLGYQTALALAGKGITVILACRNMQKAEDAKNRILSKYADAQVECREIDLSKLKSVRAFAWNFLKSYNHLDVLINNAGILMPPFSLTEDGFESQMAANYFGHFLLTNLLLDTLTNTPGSRIISLSSLAHKRGSINFDDLQFEKKYSAFKAYAQSKLSCLIFAIELQRRLHDAQQPTISLAAHPGISDTEIMRFLPKFMVLSLPLIRPLFLHKPDKGALPTLRAALDTEAKGGAYYGPGNLNEFKGPPVIVKARRKAYNKDLAKQLWSISEKLTNCNYNL